ncbi:MAG: hypothetical protein MPN21_11200 [Thermoanaerobaculia bacterium]|nr:hypothetical protein [Thermoanaerobaculia bacterium]
MQRIVANLDAESDWQALLDPQRPRRHLTRRALDLVSGFGTLLRAWADAREPGTLWTPNTVDPARLTDRLPVPRLSSTSEARPTAPDLEWGQLDRVSARVNHRRFAFELSHSLGIQLAGSRWVENLEDLRRAVSTLDRWVAKTPLSAAGRERVFGRHVPDDSTERRLHNLLSRCDGLLVEPWLDRIEDFGVLLEIDAGGSRFVSSHRQVVDTSGGFLGIDWQAEEPSEVSVWSEQLGTTARTVGEALSREGYRGPAGIDVWAWRGEAGSVELNSLAEINARLSFGWVARQIGIRLDRTRVCLRLGSAQQLAAAGSRAEPLLLPDTAGHGAAWLKT